MPHGGTSPLTPMRTRPHTEAHQRGQAPQFLPSCRRQQTPNARGAASRRRKARTQPLKKTMRRYAYRKVPQTHNTSSKDPQTRRVMRIWNMIVKNGIPYATYEQSSGGSPRSKERKSIK